MIIQADARHIPLNDGSVQCVVTSPPYWQMRNYAAGANEIGSESRMDCLGWAAGSMCGECYVCTLVIIFREIKRVLSSDGTLWLNLGDTFSHSGYGHRDARRWPKQKGNAHFLKQHSKTHTGLKPKDLLMLPARVAMALQSDGWWLRSDIVIAKRAPMPESVRDRPVRSHEFMFLLAKSERYFYDAKAIMCPASASTHARIAQPNVFSQKGGDKDYGQASNRSARKTLTNLAARARGVSPKTEIGLLGIVKNNASFAAATADLTVDRNNRDVWEVTTSPTPEAHFATFGPKWIEPCILAGSRIGDIVLDPFLGSGTTGMVCEALGRRWVGLDLNFDYLTSIARKRTAQQGLRFA